MRGVRIAALAASVLVLAGCASEPEPVAIVNTPPVPQSATEEYLATMYDLGWPKGVRAELIDAGQVTCDGLSDSGNAYRFASQLLEQTDDFSATVDILGTASATLCPRHMEDVYAALGDY